MWTMMLAWSCGGTDAHRTSAQVTLPTATPPSGDAPHGCLGAMLRAVWDVEIDAAQLVIEVEASLGHLSCWANEAAGFLECTPGGDACDWTVEEARGDEGAFLTTLAAFDPVFEEYPYSVVEDCACRVY